MTKSSRTLSFLTPGRWFVFSLIIEQSCITSFRFTHFDYCSLLAGMGTRRPVLPHCLPVSGMSPFYLSLGDLCDLWQQPSRPFPGASWQCLWTVALQKPGLSLQHPQPPFLYCVSMFMALIASVWAALMKPGDLDGSEEL